MQVFLHPLAPASGGQLSYIGNLSSFEGGADRRREKQNYLRTRLVLQKKSTNQVKKKA